MSSGAEDTSEVKGYALLSYLSGLQAQPRTWAQLLDALGRDAPESQRFFEEPLFADQWYPRRHMHALFDALDVVSDGSDVPFRKMGERAAEYQIHKVYRVFLGFATPALVFRRAGSILSRQSTAGEFRVVEDADDHLVGELIDPTVPKRLPLVIAGWSDRVVMMLRKRPNPTRVTRASESTWRFLVSWT